MVADILTKFSNKFNIDPVSSARVYYAETITRVSLQLWSLVSAHVHSGPECVDNWCVLSVVWQGTGRVGSQPQML